VAAVGSLGVILCAKNKGDIIEPTLCIVMALMYFILFTRKQLNIDQSRHYEVLETLELQN
jgi:hypothetical protein